MTTVSVLENIWFSLKLYLIPAATVNQSQLTQNLQERGRWKQKPDSRLKMSADRKQTPQYATGSGLKQQVGQEIGMWKNSRQHVVKCVCERGK